jgi:DNA-binding CsgD family transcriptional regulator
MELAHDVQEVSPADDVSAELSALAGGDPAALAALTAALTPDQRRGDAPLPVVLPEGSPLRRRYRDVLAGLPERTRWLLLLAAADPDLHPVELAEAAGEDGPDDIEHGGLATLAPSTVDFTPPFLRAIAYYEAPLARRREAHAVLGAVLTARGHRLRGLLHRAAATPRPDAGLVAALARAAAEGPPSDTAAALRQVADVTGAPGALLDAARASWLAGRPHQTGLLLRRLARAPATAAIRARARHLSGEVELRRGAPDAARDTLLDAAAELAPHDLPAALDAMLLAAEALAHTGRPGRYPEIARHTLAHSHGGEGPAVEIAAHHVAGLAALIAGDEVTGFARLRRVIHLADQVDDPAVLIRVARAAILTGDNCRAGVLATRADALARITGATALVPQALETVALADLATGHYDAATGTATAGADLARATGQPGLAGGHLGILAVLAALVGDRPTCVLRIRAAGAHDSNAYPGQSRALCEWALALLDLVEGRPLATVERLLAVQANAVVRVAAAPHLVEAANRAGAGIPVDDAGAAFDRWAGHTGQPAWLALRARCRALRAPDGEAADGHFREALGRHGHGARDFAKAHTQLLYGRELRHRRRPAAAREHLRLAGETFRLLDAQPWATQADRELRAAGERISPYPVTANVTLTAQQERIARLVAGGATNREVAQELHLSPRTIDHHLRNVFTRLGVRSRTELARLVTPA